MRVDFLLLWIVFLRENAYTGKRLKKNGEKGMKYMGRPEPKIDEWALIPMIPFGLLAGYWGTLEVRIMALAEEGFQVRLARPVSEVQKQEPLELAFYNYDTASYHRLPICDAHLVQEEQKTFFMVYTFTTELESYRREVQRLAMQYSRYIRWKMDGDDAALAEQMTGYPAEEDELHFENLEDQKRVWFASMKRDTFSAIRRGAAEGNSSGNAELALALDRITWYERYLKLDAPSFLSTYFRENQIAVSPDFYPDRLYFGNAFCPHLFPKEHTLQSLIEKASQEHFAVTLVFPILHEAKRRETERLLERLDDWCARRQETLEIVANDWGTAALAAKKKNLIPVLGVLLNKRKKDPRMHYKQGDSTLLQQNSLNAAFYRNYLKENFGIMQYEWENCGFLQTFPEGKNSLYFPFCQTNTSQHCTLYAECVNGSRGAQKEVVNCPRYCEQQAFLYPKHLQMIGRYNSLFALDAAILEHPEKIARAYARQGVDRFILNLL